MKKYNLIFSLVIILPVILFRPVLSQSGVDEMKENKSGKLIIKGLYDNYSCGENFKANHGFSCLIEYQGKSILFDAGTKEEIFLHNCKERNVDFTVIKKAVISHLHGDHIGGFSAALKKMNNPVVYSPGEVGKNLRPESFKYVSEKFEVIKQSAKVIAVDTPMAIEDKIMSTGIMGEPNQEQSLIIDTDKGIVVITGCAHPGVTAIVKKAKELVNKPVRLVIGGFHLPDKSSEEVEAIISELKSLGVQKCGATHCTGDAAIKLFKERFKENYVETGAGKILTEGVDF